MTVDLRRGDRSVRDPLEGGLARPASWIAFDIETTPFVDGELPTGITCAAAGTSDGSVVHWYSLGDDGVPQPLMDVATARGMLAWLGHWQRAGHRLVAWNGAGFDLRVLAAVSEDQQRAARLLPGLYDPMLQMLWQRGFPVALARAAEGLGLGLAKTMAGQEAPEAWARGEYGRVLEYVAGDVLMTVRVAEAIEARGGLDWVTRRGTVGHEPFVRLRTVAESLALPPPDQSWMEDPIPPRRPVAWADDAWAGSVGAGAGPGSLVG
jgi:hypothetical protein